MNKNNEIHTLKSKIFDILLQANPSSGFQWVPEFDKDAIRLVSAELLPQSNKLGGAGLQKFQFEGLKSGVTEIRLINKRVWESTAQNEETYKIYVSN